MKRPPPLPYPTLTYDVTAVAQDGDRFVVRGEDVYVNVCELAGKVGVELEDE